MVKLSPPRKPRPVVVKPARRAPRPTCVVCGAMLRSDHGKGDLVCDAHCRKVGNPRSDPPEPMRLTPEERLLVMLYRAAGRPLNVYRAFSCDSTSTNVSAFRDMVRRLNASGLVRVCGRKRVGYELASQPGEDGGKVET